MSAPTTTASPLRARAFDAFIITALIMGARYLVLVWMARATDTTPAAALSKWDAKYYMGIAEGGYFTPTQPTIDVAAHERTLAFFPALPAILRALHAVTGMDYLTAGVLVSQALSFLACVAVLTLASRCGASLWGARAAAVAIMGAPLAITMQMPYSEALFMALGFTALVFIIDQRWLAAGLLTLLAGCVRLTAVDLIAVLAIAVLVQGRRQWRAWVALAVSPLGLAGYLAWANSHLGEAGGYFGIQKAGWHSSFDFGAATVRFLHRVATEDLTAGYFISAVIIIAAVIAVPAALPAVARGHLDWRIWLFSAAVIANMVLSDGIMHSRPRLLLPAYLILIPLAARIGRATPAVRALILVSWVAVGAWTSAYFLTVFPWAI